MINNIQKNWYKLYLLISVFFVIFIYGTMVGIYQIFPYKIIHNAQLAAEDWWKNDNYKHYAKIRPEKFIETARHSANDTTTNRIKKTFEGYTLIASMWDNATGIKLIDMDGTEIHNWSVSYNSIFSNPDSSEEKITDWDVGVHGPTIYPNGDVVFTFNGRGLIKIDKNSDVIWKIKDGYHHSTFKDENGNLWVPYSKQVDNLNVKYPLLQPPFLEDFICELSPDGKLLKKISLLQVFYKSGLESLLFTNGIGWEIDRKEYDLTHLNDIDVLGSKLADQYPQFSVGDIMVSLRHLNLIMIIDAKTELIKWYMTGPYIRQHDPDFTPAGDIFVFDNRTDNSNGEILGGSRILKIDPITRNVNVVYQGDLENKFYTNIVGQQQLLPNGNILIVEHGAGRIFEVTDKGEIVWNYINKYDNDEVYKITSARRISKSYITF